MAIQSHTPFHINPKIKKKASSQKVFLLEIPNAKTRRLLAKIDRDIAAGRNLSGPYHTAEEFISNMK